MRPMILMFALLLPVYTGCSSDKTTFKSVGMAIGSAKPEAAPNAPIQRVTVNEAAQEQAPAEPKAKDKPRKIRYTADLSLIVEKLDEAEEALDAARKEAKGDFAKVETTSVTGAVRSGTWRVRVPVDNLHSFRKAVAKIGEVERNTLEADDLTAQYYDLEEDIKNRKAARETLRGLLLETGKKDMKHYLDVWDKLETISGEINRKEGQLRLWANLTDLTTVTVHMREKQRYFKDKPPEPAEVPTFGMRASKTWSGSWDLFVEFLEGVAIVAIAVTPWLPIPIVFFGLLWLLVRRLARSGKAPVALEVVEDKKPEEPRTE